MLVRVDDPTATELVQELLLAHEFWRLNRLSVDLVILNEDPGGYLQPLQEQLLADGADAARPRASSTRPGGVFVRRADQIPDEDRTLLLAVARVVLLTSKGRLARQLRAPSGRRPLDCGPLPRRGRRSGRVPTAADRWSRSSCCSPTAWAASRRTAAST